jgi:hypothetical protein
VFSFLLRVQFRADEKEQVLFADSTRVGVENSDGPQKTIAVSGDIMVSIHLVKFMIIFLPSRFTLRFKIAMIIFVAYRWDGMKVEEISQSNTVNLLENLVMDYEYFLISLICTSPQRQIFTILSRTAPTFRSGKREKKHPFSARILCQCIIDHAFC